MSDDALVKSIMDMGFPEFKAKKAIKATKATNVEQAIEWLIQNSDRLSEDDNSDDNEVEPSSFKCDECGKQLRNSNAIEFHSAKTGHVRFSESTEEVKPLTEEEKLEQKRLLEEKLKVKKQERQEREKQEEMEAEKRRREQGKVISTAKEEFQHIEMKRFMEEQKRQKEEDLRYKEELKAQIARERAEKLARDRGEVEQPKPSVAPVPQPKPVKTDECKLQIRIPGIPPLVQVFKSHETLSSVRLFVSQHWPGISAPNEYTRIILGPTYPKKDFTEDQMSISLADLNLCPASALMARLS